MYTQIRGTDTIQVMPIIATNLPVKLHQQGVTVSLSYSSKKVQVKPFVTIQQTKLKDYAPYNNTPDAGMGPLNIYSGIGTTQKHKATPAVFGGASVNYVPNGRLNINLDAYYYSSQTYSHLSNVLFNDGIRGIDHIDSKLIVNATVSYEVIKGLHIICSGKNILNDRSREFFRSDAVPLRLMAGISYEF
jgi:iron complex outermembrane receptor protein